MFTKMKSILAIALIALVGANASANTTVLSSLPQALQGPVAGSRAASTLLQNALNAGVILPGELLAARSSVQSLEKALARINASSNATLKAQASNFLASVEIVKMNAAGKNQAGLSKLVNDELSIASLSNGNSRRAVVAQGLTQSASEMDKGQKAIAARILREFRDSVRTRATNLKDDDLKRLGDLAYTHLLQVLNNGVGQVVEDGASKCVREFDPSLTPEIMNLLTIAMSVSTRARSYADAKAEILAGMESTLKVDTNEAKTRLKALIDQCNAFVRQLSPNAA